MTNQCERKPGAERNEEDLVFKAETVRAKDRARLLRDLAGVNHTFQAEVMENYRRGWSRLMIDIDNDTRERIGLPVYEYSESPVKAYIELVNGKEDGLLLDFMGRLHTYFGSEASVLREMLVCHITLQGAKRSRYAPPEELTYAIFRLDDIVPYQRTREPLFIS